VLTCCADGYGVGLLLRFLVGSIVLPENVHGDNTALASEVIQTPQLVQVPIYPGLQNRKLPLTWSLKARIIALNLL